MSVRRTMLFLTAGALAAGGSLAAAPAANATSAPLTYNCTTILGAADMSVVTDTGLPAVMHVGQSLPTPLTSTVTVPASIIGLVYGLLGGRTASGTATANGIITAPDGTTTTTQTPLTVPSTEVPATGDMTVRSSGTGPAFEPTMPGVYTISAGDFSSTLSFYGSDPTAPPVLADQTIPCTAPTGVSTVVDKVTVKYASTTSLALARASAPYGQRVAATATVSSTGATTGSVRFTAGGQTVTAPVRAGKATALLPVLHAGGQRVTAAFVPSNSQVDTSSATKALSVTRAATRTAAAMTVARVHRLAKARVVVRSAAGVPTGRVTVVLKKGAHRVVRKVVSLHSGRALVRLKRIATKGRYTLTVTYAGTHDLAGSKVVKRFRVRR